MKQLLFLLLMISFFNCGPKVQFENDKIEMNKSSEEVTIKYHNIEESKYSLLMLTTGFAGEKVQVRNCDAEVYNGILSTDIRQPFAKAFRLINTCDTEIFEVEKNYSFKIKSKFAAKYKFIYIIKDYDNRYVITYTNVHKRIL